MEALILIFGELVFTILAPFVTLVFELLAAVVGFVLSLVVGGTADGTAERQPGQKSRMSQTTRTISLVLVGLAVVMLSAVWIVNSFYFENAMQYAFSKVEERSAVATNCEEVNGSFFQGRVKLGNCTIRRPVDAATSFDLRVETIEIDVRVTSLLGTARIDTARVEGLAGWVTKNHVADDKPDSSAKKSRSRRAFETGLLDISSVNIVLSGTNADGNPFELPIEIEKLRSEPLRSRLALFDVLFRSNAAGSIARAPFEISSSVIQDGRQTAWRAEQVPVASFGAMVGGPLSWFRSGVVDIAVDDRWQRGDSLDIDMDWRLNFQDIEVKPPPGAGAMARVMSAPLAGLVNSLGGRLPLEFQLVVNEDQFEYKSSLAAAGLWSAVEKATSALLARVGVDGEDDADAGNTIGERAKSVLDRLRKPKTEETE